MNMNFDIPDGFLWSGVASGIKKQGKKDLGLAYSSYPAISAGVFTENVFEAAPVQTAREKLRSSAHTRGLVVNSGVANAATGEEGLRRNRQMISEASERLGLEEQQVLSSSTGIIGKDLPVDTIKQSLPDAVDGLAEHPKQFSEAILTTDTRSKISSRSVGDSTLLGVAKGSGMIRPQMATMLAFLFIDRPVEAGFLHESLQQAVESSFNKITVDGEMSTNDTVLVMAADLPNKQPIQPDDSAGEQFQQALSEVTSDLAREIVRDGEGSTCVCEVRVTGAPSQRIADDVVNLIANSNLVKTALHVRSPYSGRVFSAIGASGHPELDPQKLTIRFNGFELFHHGRPVDPDTDVRDQLSGSDELLIEVDLGVGNIEATRWTCDFSEEYVSINSKV